MNELYNFIKQNKTKLQLCGEKRLTNGSIAALFDSSMFNAIDLLGDKDIKHAIIKLKYGRFAAFIDNISELKNKRAFS